jgi:uncharacterized membrane protein/mono/diheme cytochrome c family protein
MNSRLKLLLCGVGLFVVLVLLFAVLKAPPDGVERGELRQFVGRFHPLAVHLPITLVLLVVVFECAGIFRAGKDLQTSAGFVLALAAATGLVAVFLGWMLGRSGGYEGALVTQHMWGGISLAAALVLCCAIRGWNGKLYGIALFATVGLMAWTSDQGGKLTHGAGFLTEHMPGKLRSLLGVAPPAKRHSSDTPPPSPANLRAADAAAPAPAPVAFFASRVAPIFDDKCVQCHGPEKKKGKLRLDTFDYVMRGGKDGVVVKSRDAKNSELYRRIMLPRDNKDAMPAEGKPGLTAAELKVIEFWIAAGASQSLAPEEVRAAPPLPPSQPLPAPPAADYRPRSGQIETLEAELAVRLVPRSQNPRDGLILRTVSAPERCDDSVLAALKPVADLILDAELARTKITDAGMKALGGFVNLRSVDLSYTAVTSQGLAPFASLTKLETLNLTGTDVDDQGVQSFRRKPGLRHLYLFATKCSQDANPTNGAAEK